MVSETKSTVNYYITTTQLAIGDNDWGIPFYSNTHAFDSTTLLLRNRVDQRQRNDLHTRYVTIMGERRLVSALLPKIPNKFLENHLIRIYRPHETGKYWIID